MKSHRRSHLRRFRRLAVALACTAALLALPAVASARVAPPDPPVSHHTSAPADASPSPVTIVKKDDGRTLSIVLASAALGVSLCGAGYVVIRARGFSQIQPGRAS